MARRAQAQGDTMTTIVGPGTALKCQRCGTKLRAKDGIYRCPKCDGALRYMWWTVYLMTALLAAALLTVMLTEARAQITPSWQQSPVLKKPGSPSPADLFRHKCPPRMVWNPHWRRCVPMRRGGSYGGTR
jgi:ribosomal protein L37AE/L43A